MIAQPSYPPSRSCACTARGECSLVRGSGSGGGLSWSQAAAALQPGNPQILVAHEAGRAHRCGQFCVARKARAGSSRCCLRDEELCVSMERPVAWGPRTCPRSPFVRLSFFWNLCAARFWACTYCLVPGACPPAHAWPSQGGGGGCWVAMCRLLCASPEHAGTRLPAQRPTTAHTLGYLPRRTSATRRARLHSRPSRSAGAGRGCPSG